MSFRRITSFFFLATTFCCTFEKIHWSFGGSINLSDFLAIAFILCFALTTRGRVPRTTAVLLGFFAAFMLVYLGGFYNLVTADALSQFTKGLIKFIIHFLFFATAVTWIYRRGETYYWRTLGWFAAGMAFNGLYGIAQLLVARAGGNLDQTLISPLTGGASQINVYGIVQGAKVYRTNALTGDPNHLGVMLIVPLLVLTPLYLRMERGHRLRGRLGALIAFLLIAEIATLSRSGLLGLFVGLLVLAIPYRRYLRSKALLLPLASVAVILSLVVLSRLHYFEVIWRSRIQTSGSSQHFQVYNFIPAILHSHPLLGLGLNNFSIYYEFVTGKSNWGPHSFYVSLIVETGIIGTALFAALLIWVFARLGVARRLGDALMRVGNPVGAEVHALAWGWTAAVAGTMASNIFYLTMQFYYFYVFLALAVTVPVVFGREATVSVPAVVRPQAPAPEPVHA